MSSAIQKQEQAPTLQSFLSVRKTHLEQVLPKSKGLTSDKLIKLAILATNRQPALQKCDMGSVFLALLQCAELGLEPSGTLGGAYLVPYGSQCQLIVGYRGLIDLARRSGALKQIEAHVVHEKDRFKLRFGLEPLLEHEPFLDGDPGAARLVYCVALLADGAKHVEVMTMPEIQKIRALSKAKNSPWDSHFEEMAKKTVARRTCKWVPMSSELAKALEIEEETEHGRGPEAGDVVAIGTTAPSQTAKAKDAVRARLEGAKTASGFQVIDVKPGQTEEEAIAAAAAPDGEPPPPSDSDAPPNL